MKYSTIYLVIGAAVLSVGIAVAVLLLGSQADSDLWELLPLTGLNALMWSGNAARFIWGWKRNQARHNQAIREGKVFVLAPKTAERVGDNQLWRRVPEHLRTEEKVQPHVAWELFSTSRQMGYLLSVPSHLAQAVTSEVTREWPGITIEEVKQGA